MLFTLSNHRRHNQSLQSHPLPFKFCFINNYHDGLHHLEIKTHPGPGSAKNSRTAGTAEEGHPGPRDARAGSG